LILVDTSVWVDHLRSGDEHLATLLNQGKVLMHPFVMGELSLGSLANRATVLELLRGLPSAAVAGPSESLLLVDRHKLHGRGIGYVDLHLLASTLMSDGATLWSRDKRLILIAGELGCAYSGSS
jgi:predicted nucleic acid-binding protein